MILSYALFIAAILFIQTANATANTNNKGKLLATAATTSIEGSAGGGIVPWAVLSGYDTREQISIGSFATRVDAAAYRLDSYGLSAGLYDRIELSAAHHTFDLKRSNTAIEQDIFGAKIRLFGDIVYTEHPQISIGLQHKKLLDTNIATAVGADTTHSGTDIYLAATKLHLGLAAGYNVLWNMNLRRTKANQLGLLGFGGDKNDDYEWLGEGSLAIMPNRHLAFGIEYRQKPDNLSFAKEEDWNDVFIAWFPNKHINVTAAWADLGDIAGVKDQQGWYLSLTAYLR